MTPEPVWPPFPALSTPPESPPGLADALAQWAHDTLAHQAASLALPGSGGRHLTPLPACHAWVERICQVLLSRARELPLREDRPVLLLGVQDLADCPDDLLPSLGRLQELGALGQLGGYQLLLPGMLAASIAQYSGLGPVLPQERPEPTADGAVGEDTPLLPVARGGGAADRCVVS